MNDINKSHSDRYKSEKGNPRYRLSEDEANIIHEYRRRR